MSRITSKYTIGEAQMQQDIGIRLRLQRVAKNVHQWEVARSAGMTPTMLSDIELGKRKPTDAEIEHIEMAIIEGGVSMLEGEDRATLDMAGVSEQEFLARCFSDNAAIYKAFAADRRELRKSGKWIPPVVLTEANFKQMAEFGVQPIAWLAVEYGNRQRQVQGMLDGEKAVARFEANAAAQKELDDRVAAQDSFSKQVERQKAAWQAYQKTFKK